MQTITFRGETRADFPVLAGATHREVPTWRRWRHSPTPHRCGSNTGADHGPDGPSVRRTLVGANAWGEPWTGRAQDHSSAWAGADQRPERDLGLSGRTVKGTKASGAGFLAAMANDGHLPEPGSTFLAHRRLSEPGSDGASRAVRLGLKIPFELTQFFALVVQIVVCLNAATFNDANEFPITLIPDAQ